MKTLGARVRKSIQYLAEMAVGPMLDERLAKLRTETGKIQLLQKAVEQQGRLIEEFSASLKSSPAFLRENSAFTSGNCWSPSELLSTTSVVTPHSIPSELENYFDRNLEGRGIWKWRHYFEIYERHLGKFRRESDRINMAEVGIYSGGSLGMWQHYFGERLRIHGIDIREECRVYEETSVQIHIGDQADRMFWQSFREQVPALDILIDDGGHTPQQQRVTLEEMLPHIKPGGIYICEDIHGIGNDFFLFVAGIVDQFNHYEHTEEEIIASSVTPLQACYHSVHFYPYMVVIEKLASPRNRLFSEKRGSKWQPFPVRRA